ncbi:MAG TPA: SET domain-containing protein [Gammaproteobacteria bacterium]|jgi:hypothetical protein|nr:SET domain-containing protein [Gammaproteobacteria bacterium]
MKPLVRGNIEVRPSHIHGLGVFATSAIPAGTLLEECYVLRVPSETKLLRSYLFRYTDEESAIPLGFGAIYNHADRPNVNHEIDRERNVMRLKTNRPIAKGEEIFISYGNTWFSSRHIKPAQASWFYRASRWLRTASLPRVGLLTLVLFMVLGHVST